MADYLVLEEDGTSRLELEESTDDLLLEDGSLVYDEQTGYGRIGATGSGSKPPAPTPYATWKVGTITSPGSTGSQAVTGLGGTPKAVIFYGTNWTEEDTVVSASGRGMFRGMAAPRYTDYTLIQQAVTNTPTGNQTGLVDNSAIYMQSTAGTATTLYQAAVTSLDAGGFTLNWTAAASGYTIIYIALFDVTECAAAIAQYNNTFAFGFKAGASLLQGHRGGSPFSSATNTQGWYGGAAYPGTDTTDWQSGSVINATFPDAGGQRLNKLISLDPTIQTAAGVDNFAAFLSENVLLVHPAGTGLGNMTFTGGMGGGAGNYGMVIGWDDDDSMAGIAGPAASVSGTTTISGLSFAPGLVVGYTISDVPQGGGAPLGAGALGFWVATHDFQWCCVSESDFAYQSFTNGFADTVTGTNLHAGTVELTADGFVLTTTVADTTQHNVAWHAFGHPTPLAVWIPQSYRRL